MPGPAGLAAADAPYNAVMMTSPVLVLSLKLLFVLLAVAGGLRCAGRVNQARLWQSEEGVHALAAALAGAVLGAKFGFALQYPQLVLAVLAGEQGALWIAVAGNSVPGAATGAAAGLMLALPGRAAIFGAALLPGLFASLLILDTGTLVWCLTEAGFGAPARRWGIDFGDGVSRHPVMLYDAAAMAGLIWAARVARDAGLDPVLRVCLIGGACFGIWFLLGFLKAPFGPVLLLEAVAPMPLIYRPGFSGEQWLSLLVLLGLGWHGVRYGQRSRARPPQDMHTSKPSESLCRQAPSARLMVPPTPKPAGEAVWPAKPVGRG